MHQTNMQHRKNRTRTLIQLGGLVRLSGLSDVCEISDGDDLQYDLNNQEKAALLLGVLSDAHEKFLRLNNADIKNKHTRFGATLLKKAAAKTVY